METIATRKIFTCLHDEAHMKPASNTQIRNGRGFYVDNFYEMAEVVAELQFRNTDQILFFRGQNDDFRNQQNNTSIAPSIFRPPAAVRATKKPRAKSSIQEGKTSRKLDPKTLEKRYEDLIQAENLLVKAFEEEKTLLGRSRVLKHRMVRWSILQHYDVCPTPLLDVTHSLRIAASFGSMGAQDEAFLYVLGIPALGGAVTVDAASGIQIIRLASVCPPSAKRPHLQEGYLLGEYPDLGEVGQSLKYGRHEVDFGRRLVAKLRFNPETFWDTTGNHFPKVTPEALYLPDELDELRPVAAQIKNTIESI
jgi:hypothetical protein